ncbi:MAG: MMPL family transporter, partial [Thermoguttaceae bacterium]
MSAEGMPHENSSLLSRALVWLTWLALRSPAATVAIGILAALVSLYLCQTQLGFRTSRADLLNPKSPFNRLWLDYVKEFGDSEDVIVVVEGAPAKVICVLDQLAAELNSEHRLWNSVLHKIDLEKIHRKGLYYLKGEELAGIEQFLDRFAPVLRGDWSVLNLGNMAAQWGGFLRQISLAGAQDGRSQAHQAAIQGQIARFFASLARALAQQGVYQSPWPEMSNAKTTDASRSKTQYLLGREGRMGFILLRFAPQTNKDSFVGNTQAVDALRDVVNKARARYPNTSIGVTGLPIIEHDEMASSETSMTLATGLSIVGVIIVVFLGFGGLWHALLPMAAPVLGLIWSLGYTVLTVGHLNILSSAFGAILTGLGINYGIYIIARYLQLREAGKTIEEALLETAGSVAPGLTVGMIATAAAFYMAGFTEFIGVAELGLIAGGGVVLCWLASMTVLPALIYLCDKKPCSVFPQPLEFYYWLKPLHQKPRVTLFCGLCATLFLALGMTRLWYDHNLLHMQAAGSESVALEEKILNEGDQSASFAISIADDARELLQRKQRFLALPSVKKVVEIDSILIPDKTMSANQLEQKRQLIERIHRRLTNLPQQIPQIPLPSMGELERMLSGAQNFVTGSPSDENFTQQLRQLGMLFRRLPAAECYARLAAFQQSMAHDLLTRLYKLRQASDPQPPQLSDLPPSLVTRFVGRTGKHLMKIYSK